MTGPYPDPQLYADDKDPASLMNAVLAEVFLIMSR